GTTEKLRLLILNYNMIESKELTEFPLCVTYLTTEKKKNNQVGNFVGYTDDENPNVIIMNDFIIQFFNNRNSISFFDFYVLNNTNDYYEFLNLNDKNFVFSILSNKKRSQFLNEFILNDKVKSLNEFYKEKFSILYYRLFGVLPSSILKKKYLIYLHQGNEGNL